MFLKEFNQSGTDRIAKVNKFLNEEFSMSITGFPKREKLERISAITETAISKLKSTNTKFQLNPEYAKFLGVRDVVNTMLTEGMYAESPAYHEMKQHLVSGVRKLMDSGCTNEEAVSQCMNDYRKDSRWCYDDEHVLPIVIKAAKEYVEEGPFGGLAGGAGGAALGAKYGSGVGDAIGKGLTAMGVPGADLGGKALGAIAGGTAGALVGDELTDSVSEKVLRAMSEEIGIKIEDVASYDAIAEKLNMFAGVSGKSPNTVVRFLDELDEDTLPQGIKYFGAQVAEANAFVKARKDAIKAGKDEFEVDGKVYKVTGDKSQELEEAVDELSNLVEDIPRIIRTATGRATAMDKVKNVADKGVDAIKGAGATVSKAVGDVGTAAGKELSLVAPKLAKQMKANPKLAGAGTLGLGALAAYGGYKGLKKLLGKDKKKESMFDDIINDILAEEFEGTTVEEAEVVMAIRALVDDIQDHVERLGRMKNEDIPAIADQLKNEQGLQAAQSFKDQAEQLLDDTLNSAKAGKEGIDGLIASITGQGGALQEPMPASEPDMDDMMAPEVDDIEDIAMDDNEPAGAGPEDEPLGRAPIEV